MTRGRPGRTGRAGAVSSARSTPPGRGHQLCRGPVAAPPWLLRGRGWRGADDALSGARRAVRRRCRVGLCGVGRLSAQGRVRAVERRTGLGGHDLLRLVQAPRGAQMTNDPRPGAALKMPADKRTGRPGRPARTLACRRPWRSSMMRSARIGNTLADRMRRFGSEPPGQGHPSPLTVLSPDLAAGAFPTGFTCDGANRRPRLQWSTPPSGTPELAV